MFRWGVPVSGTGSLPWVWIWDRCRLNWSSSGMSGGADYRPSPGGIFPLEDGVIEQGRVADGEALSRQLRQIFKELKLKRRDTFLCVGNNTVILRSFTLPAMSPPVEIAAAVRWEAARYHPVPDEMITDYIVTGERSSNGKRVVETGVVSVPREIVAGYLEPVSRAGFRPAGVEIEPLALCRAARFFYRHRGGRQETVAGYW